jgi:zinc transport system substrate-binding protein
MLRGYKTGVFVGILLCFSGAVFAGGKKDVSSSRSTEKPIIAVSIVPEATFAENVGGNEFEIITMIPPGSSPENYEPTPSEIAKFSKAVLYFTVGVPTEKAHILAQTSKSTKIVHLENIVAKSYDERHFADGERDPHIWLSPKRAEVMVRTMAIEMGQAFPSSAATFTSNADAYCTRLEMLEKDVAGMLTNLKSKKFIVYHPAFGYFAQDFGLEMVALEEEGKEATPQHMMDMIDYARKNNIKVVFYQSEIDSSQSKSFAEEIGGVTEALAPLSGDYINNLKLMATTIAKAQSK